MMAKKSYFFIFLSFLLFWEIGEIFSQPVQQQWAAWYDNPNNLADISYGMVVDANGNVYVTGNSGTINSRNVFTTVKYNSSGILQWARIYEEQASSDNQPIGINLDSLGNIYVFGYSGSIFNQIYHAVIIKYNSNGDSLWVRKYYGGGNNHTDAQSAGIDKSGNICMSGGGDFNRLFIVKYNANGDTLWNRNFPPPSGFTATWGVSLALDTNQNIYIGGICNPYYPPNPSIRGFLVTKYNPSGSLQWYATDYSLDTDSYINKIALDYQGNIFAIGASSGYRNNIFRYQTEKFGNNGAALWKHKYFQGYDDWAYDVVTDNSGASYVTGLVSYSNSYYATIKYNTTGDSSWVRTFGFHHNLGVGKNKICIDSLSNLYVIGITVDSLNNGYISTIKYNSLGVQQWLMEFVAGIGSAPSYYITCDKYLNVYSCGSASQYGYNNLNFITIKYSQPIGIEKNSNQIISKFELSQNYPNPFNPNTEIEYDLPKSTFVKLTIYDVLGNEVKTLVNEKQNAGSYNVEFDGSKLPSGVYFYKITAGDFTAVKKMVLVK